MATETVHGFLVDRLRSLPQADSLALLDNTGRIVNFSRTWPIPVIEAGDRDFFKYLREHDDPAPVIGLPVINRFSKAWVIMIAHRINGVNGEFLGVAVGVIEARYFEDFYKEVRAEDTASAGLFRGDGILLARYPRVEDKIGSAVTRQSQWYETLAGGGGAYRTSGDGEEPSVSSRCSGCRITARVTVGIDEAVALAPWRRQALIIAIGAIGAVAGFAFLFRTLESSSAASSSDPRNWREAKAASAISR